MALVETRINYFNPPVDGSKPYQWITEGYPGGGPMRNWEPLEHDVRVQNIRGQETGPEYKLDTTGFEFHRIPNKANVDFNDDEDIKASTMPNRLRTSRTLPELQGLSFSTEPALRKPRPAGTPETPENRSPVKLAHVDQTNESAKRRVHLHLPESDVPASSRSGSRLLTSGGRSAMLHGSFPLRYVISGLQNGDFVPSTLKYLDRDGETLAVKYNPEHKWKYLAGMTPDEFVLIKCFDSVQDNGIATFTPHTAIEDPTTPSNAPDASPLSSVHLFSMTKPGALGRNDMYFS
ncbi:hypothetical protein RHS01_04306 [Rhizoctonia solani]|uniref:Uncharacterized protein n=1 Tax=Rhizoctonia solani TaxID=456999 RepID=A0A8H7IFC4_9AGAM|nr:hypothetical protein RHS01_04306 [Rhizoctonia solani]